MHPLYVNLDWELTQFSKSPLLEQMNKAKCDDCKEKFKNSYNKKNIKDTEKYISAKKKEMFMKTVYQNFTVPSVVTTE